MKILQRRDEKLLTKRIRILCSAALLPLNAKELARHCNYLLNLNSGVIDNGDSPAKF